MNRNKNSKVFIAACAMSLSFVFTIGCGNDMGDSEEGGFEYGDDIETLTGETGPGDTCSMLPAPEVETDSRNGECKGDKTEYKGQLYPCISIYDIGLMSCYCEINKYDCTAQGDYQCKYTCQADGDYDGQGFFDNGTVVGGSMNCPQSESSYSCAKNDDQSDGSWGFWCEPTTPLTSQAQCDAICAGEFGDVPFPVATTFPPDTFNPGGSVSYGANACQ